MRIESLTSFSNEKIKFAISLKEKREREQSGLIFVEGFREISRLAQNKNFAVQSIFFCEEFFLGGNEMDLIQSFSLKTVFSVSTPVFRKLSFRDRPDGIIAIAKPPSLEIPKEGFRNFSEKSSFVLVVEGVEKPGNLGTILRTADGAKVDAVFVADSKTDVWNPNVIRASTGIVFTLPIFSGAIQEIISVLQGFQFQILSITPEAKKNLYETDLKGKTALVFGSEQYGLSAFAKEHASELVSLPMLGVADSLNLAQCASVCIYEAIRQRNYAK